jgi:dTDP-glucose pyrophosphorylase
MIKLIVFNLDNTYPEFISTVSELQARGYILYAVDNISVKELNRKIVDLECQIYFSDYCHNNLLKVRDYYIEIISNAIENGFSTREILVVDDNYTNVKTASSLGLSICLHNSKEEILDTIRYYNNENHVKPSIFGKRINIVVPIMGDSIRFQKSRYRMERNLILMMNKMVLFWTLSNLQIDANYIFVIREHLCRLHKFDQILASLYPNCKIIQHIPRTEGNVCSVLLAEKYIDNNDPLVVVDDNQWLEWDVERLLMKFLLHETALLQMITFNPYSNMEYHYVRTDPDNDKVVREIMLNKPMSEHGLTDVYFWRHGEDFVKYAHRMNSRNQRYRGEFCTSLIANELFDDIRNNKIPDNSVIHVGCSKFFKFNEEHTLEEFRRWYENRIRNPTVEKQ